MKINNRKIVLVDGSNFYFKLKDLGLSDLLSFHFQDFGKMLVGLNKSEEITYYVGAVRTDGSKKAAKLFAYQRKLLAYLKLQRVKYYLGYLLKTDGGFKEKGVDVKMATDILLGACQDKYDQVFLVSSDSDLVPAIEGAQKLGKVVIYVGFKHMPSYALRKACKKTVLLTKDDLLTMMRKS